MDPNIPAEPFDPPSSSSSATMNPLIPDWRKSATPRARARALPSASPHVLPTDPRNPHKRKMAVPTSEPVPSKPTSIESAPVVYASSEGGPSYKKPRRHHNSVPQQMRNAVHQPDISEGPVPDDNADQHIKHLTKLLRGACDEITSLRNSLSATEARHRRTCQDMMLSFMLQQDKADAKLRRECARLSRLGESHKFELESKVECLREANNEIKKAREVETRSLREVIAHHEDLVVAERQNVHELSVQKEAMIIELDDYSTLLRSAEDNVIELQRIDNEERELRSNSNQGLPPAYGSLDDVESLPPWGRHEDGGTFEIATIKHTIREKFMQDLALAQKVCNIRRRNMALDKTHGGGGWLLHTSAMALADACSCMSLILDKAEDVLLSHGKQKRKDDIAADRSAKSSVSKRSIIANRIAIMILDMSRWMLAAFDARNLEVPLVRKFRAKTGEYMKAADDAMLKALRAAFWGGKTFEDDPMGAHAHQVICRQCSSPECSGHCERLNELQYFLTMLKEVSNRFDKLTEDHWHITCFTSSESWLEECVETERRLAANAQCFSPREELSRSEEMELVVAAAVEVRAARGVTRSGDAGEFMAAATERLQRSGYRTTGSHPDPPNTGSDHANPTDTTPDRLDVPNARSNRPNASSPEGNNPNYRHLALHPPRLVRNRHGAIPLPQDAMYCGVIREREYYDAVMVRFPISDDHPEGISAVRMLDLTPEHEIARPGDWD